MIRKNIPNFITSLNILTGMMAVVCALKSENWALIAPLLIFMAAIFDFLDGFAARMLKAYSEMGKQLDSLADVISFGAAPAAIVHRMFWEFTQDSPYIIDSNLTVTQWFVLVFPLLLLVFAALRLAKFNIDTRQTDSFIGLPTPAMAIFMASLALSLHFDKLVFLQNAYFIPVWVVLFSWLMVSEIPMFSLKFKSFGLGGNQVRYSFLAFSLIMLIIFQIAGIPLIIAGYILLSGLLFAVAPKDKNLQK